MALLRLAALQRKVVRAKPSEPAVEGLEELPQIVALVRPEFLLERVNIFVERTNLIVQRNVVIALRC